MTVTDQSESTLGPDTTSEKDAAAIRLAQWRGGNANGQ